MCMLSCFSHVRLCVTLCTVAHQAPLSMGFSIKEYWSGLPCPSPGNLPDPGIKPRFLALQTDSLPSEPLFLLNLLSLVLWSMIQSILVYDPWALEKCKYLLLLVVVFCILHQILLVVCAVHFYILVDFLSSFFIN